MAATIARSLRENHCPKALGLNRLAGLTDVFASMCGTVWAVAHAVPGPAMTTGLTVQRKTVIARVLDFDLANLPTLLALERSLFRLWNGQPWSRWWRRLGASRQRR